MVCVHVEAVLSRHARMTLVLNKLRDSNKSEGDLREELESHQIKGLPEHHEGHTDPRSRMGDHS